MTNNELALMVNIAVDMQENGVNSVLDKIKAEIIEEQKGYSPSADEYKTINKVLQIIDKYRKGE